MRLRNGSSLLVMGASLLLLAGCGGDDGGAGRCRYGEYADQTGVVTITSISEPVVEQGSVTRDIGVAGLHDGFVTILDADFAVCVPGAGLGVGSEVPARIVAGGPCPPVLALASCPRGLMK